MKYFNSRSYSSAPIYTRSRQDGNVLFYILIAVALIAALSYAVSQSNRGSVTGLTDERAKLAASETIEYGNIVAQAVSQLKFRGVDEDELCFDHESWGVNDYDHAGCNDNFNKLFHPDGAGLIWSVLPDDVTDSSASPDNLWHIYGDTEVEGVGTTCGAAACADLLLVADELSLDVCLKINDLLGITNPSSVPPTDSAIGTTRYIGSFGYTATLGDEAGGSVLENKTSGCFQKTDPTAKYTFYRVLLAH